MLTKETPATFHIGMYSYVELCVFILVTWNCVFFIMYPHIFIK